MRRPISARTERLNLESRQSQKDRRPRTLRNRMARSRAKSRRSSYYRRRPPRTWKRILPIAAVVTVVGLAVIWLGIKPAFFDGVIKPTHPAYFFAADISTDTTPEIRKHGA